MAALSFAAAPGLVGALGGGLAIVMLAIAVTDARRFIIPDELNAAGLALGLIYAGVQGEGDLYAVAIAVLRAAVLALSFFALRALYRWWRGREGLGLGDVKLAGVAGAWLAWSAMPIAVEIAALSALAAFAVRYYVLRRPLRRTSRLPFGLFFAPAIWITWLLETSMLHGV